MITNFGGNIQFTPRHLYAPSTEAEVLDILDRHAHGKIRVVGALHAWSPAVQCDDAIVDMRHFDGVTVDPGPDGAMWATVGGGCRIKHLLDNLHRLGEYTMPSLGLITEQAIAGAISTATHGSGKHSLSHYIDEMRVAAYDADTGKARIYTWSGGPELQAARCALGCMGIILAVRFRCVPKYDVAETIVARPTLDEVLTGESAFPLQQFFLVPYLWSYFVQRRVATPVYQPRRSLGAKLYRAWWYLNIDVGLHLVIKLLASAFKSPALVRFFFRRVLAKLILKNLTVTDHSERMLTMAHEMFKHLEIEIFVPATHVRSAAVFVQEVLQVFDGAGDGAQVRTELERIGMFEELQEKRGSFTHHYAVTFRRVLADDALISMTAGADEPWYAISFITYVEPREPFYALASFLARSMLKLFQARLHWGKYFPLSNTDIESSYPRLAEFRALCRRVDPHGVFRNEFAERVLFGGAPGAQNNRDAHVNQGPIMSNLAVTLGRLKLQNPILVASGTFGYAREMAGALDFAKLGGIIPKTVTRLPRIGNLPPRTVETASGMLNAIGLDNDGIDHFIAHHLPYLRTLPTAIIANIAGKTADEFTEMAEKIGKEPGLAGLELNLSCPNVSGGLDFATDAAVTGKIIADVRRVCPLPLIAKLTPNVTSVVPIAQAAADNGADAVSLINTIVGMAIDWRKRTPILGNVTGGLSGPAIKPLALRLVWLVASKVRVPVIGVGGIRNLDDVMEFLVAGASAVQIGTANFFDPTVSVRLVDELKAACADLGIASVVEIVGTLRLPEAKA